MRNFAYLAPLLLLLSVPTRAEDPWIITDTVVIDAPQEAGTIVVAAGGELRVEGVGEPGFRLAGHLWVIDGGRALLSDSVVVVPSVYNAQYNATAAQGGELFIQDCDYRVPNGVHHGIGAWSYGRVEIQNTNFDFAQLLAGEGGELYARALNGSFECIVFDKGHMELARIPREKGQGQIWVWPTFTPGSRAVYSPPLPGFIRSYSFPPPNSSDLDVSFHIKKSNVLLWPMLVREDTDLTLRDIPEDNWTVVGFHFRKPTTISSLQNGLTYEDTTLPFEDRTFRLENASIDTWNIYAEDKARVTVRDSHIGELLAMNRSRVRIENTKVDGSGGYLGASERGTIEALDSTFTCDIQASQKARITLRNSRALPYPQDPTGDYTRFGAYDDASLHADHTEVETTPALDGNGTIALTWLVNAPLEPPGSQPLTLYGWAALYSQNPNRDLSRWVLEAVPKEKGKARKIGKGINNVEGGSLGTWDKSRKTTAYELLLTLEDEQGRNWESRALVPAEDDS